MKPIALFLVLLCFGCHTMSRTQAIHSGMSRDEVIHTLGKVPDFTSATPDGTEILVFGFPSLAADPITRQPGTRVRFPVYFREGKAVAWGSQRGGLEPDFRQEHIVTRQLNTPPRDPAGSAAP